MKLLISAILMSFAMQASASAPLAKTGNPGYYRFKVGNIEVNVISDGTAELPMGKLLTNATPKEIKTALDKNFLGEQIETSVNTFLVNTGAKLVLIDTGAGGGFGATGDLVEHMKAAGYKPDQVDAILITHMHGDHIGGLSKDGKRVFKNATVYIGKEDIDYWLDKANMEKAPEDKKKMFEGCAAAVGPYQKEGKLTPITEDMEITPGIRTQAAHGHTPGHTIYVVESGGKKLMLLGDMIHVAAVQFAKPSACMQFDSDTKKAEKQREMTFSTAAKEGDMIGAAHLSFPGVGHLRAEKNGYTFVPLNYTR